MKFFFRVPSPGARAAFDRWPSHTPGWGQKKYILGGGGRASISLGPAPGVVVRFVRGMMERERFGPEN